MNFSIQPDGIMKRLFFLYVMFFSVSFVLFAQSPSNQPKNSIPSIEAVRIDKPIELTGKLDNPLWLKAVPAE